MNDVPFKTTLMFALGVIAGLLITTGCKAEAIASMNNQGGGKIVLTNETCEIDGKTYKSLNRAYNYTSEGYGSEGCYAVEDETVVVVWKMSTGKPQTMRYEANNFTILKKAKTQRYGT